MKNVATTIFLCFLCSITLFSQVNRLNYVLPILNIDTKIQSRGMGDIGVVSSGTNYQSAFNQNPALLAKGTHLYDGHVNYMPLTQRVNGFGAYIASIGGMLSIDEAQAVGINFKYFSEPGISEVVITGSYAYNFLADNQNNDFMVGGSAKFLQSRYRAFTNVSGVGAAFDLGASFSTTNEITDDNYLRWAIGLAITNIGGKFRYDANTIGNFIPTNIRLGTMLGYKLVINQDNTLTISAAYQADKLGIPTPTNIDNNNNNIEDYLEQSASAAFFSSFNDALRDGEEAEEITHKLGVEARLDVPNVEGFFAFRAGRYIQHFNKGNLKYNTIGGTIGIRGFYIDVALQSFPNNFNFIGFGLGYQTFL